MTTTSSAMTMRLHHGWALIHANWASRFRPTITTAPVRATTDTVYINSRKRYVNLIRTTLRGAPIEMAAPEDKDARPLRIPRIAKGDMAPGFMIDLVLKDLANVAEAARARGVPLAGTALAETYFRSAQSQGAGKKGTEAMSKTLESMGNFRYKG